MNKQYKLSNKLEELGQISLFGYDNLSFKTINHPKSHRLINLCRNFRLKKILIKKKFQLTFIKI